jgi:hypothetical protein
MVIGYELCMQHLIMYWDLQVNHTRESTPEAPNQDNQDYHLLGLFARWTNLNVYNDDEQNPGFNLCRIKYSIIV